MAARGHFVFPIDAKNHRVLVIWDLNGYGEYEFDRCICDKVMACTSVGVRRRKRRRRRRNQKHNITEMSNTSYIYTSNSDNYPPLPQLATFPDQIINKRQTLTSGWSSPVAPALFSDPETWPHAPHANKCTHKHPYMGNTPERAIVKRDRSKHQTLPIGRSWPNRNQSYDQKMVRSGVTGA